MTANIFAMNSSGTLGWNRSDIELTNTLRGLRHLSGSVRTSSCRATPNPGPDVRGSPSVWYRGEPIALSRFAIVRA